MVSIIKLFIQEDNFNARSDDYNSASSQFFIVQQNHFDLDGVYAAFGKVTEGMEIVDRICDDTIVEDEMELF
jgi:peptidyl-prolyl cis-trans isomerase B (cyclophilin B)